jgi:hypothetical protein
MTRWQSRIKVDQAIAMHTLHSCSMCIGGISPRPVAPNQSAVIHGPSLAIRRKDLGLTQHDLSIKTGVGVTCISDVELAKRDVKIATLVRLYEGIGLELVRVPGFLAPSVLELIGKTAQIRL